MKVELSEMEILMVGTLLSRHVHYPDRLELSDRLLALLGPSRPSDVSYSPPVREKQSVSVK